MSQLNTDLQRYLNEAFKRVYLRKAKLGLPDSNISEDLGDFTQKVEGFIQGHQQMSELWNSEECKEARLKEEKKYVDVNFLENDCIDGRIVRAFKGDADILQTEKAVISLQVVPSNGEIIPRSSDVCSSLAKNKSEVLVLGLAHFDSKDAQLGCAAIEMALNDPLGIEEESWRYLNEEEKKSVFEARTRSNEEANLTLIHLTTSKAITSYTNSVRAERNLPELKRICIEALYDTRTMGIIIKPPIFKESSINLELESKDRAYLSTTELALQLKDSELASSFPIFGLFEKSFTDPYHFKEFANKATNFAVKLDEMESEIKTSMEKFITTFFSELTEKQKKALMFRLFRKIAHQYLTGLAIAHDHHPFLEHQEKYISVSKGAKFIGKYNVQNQHFSVYVDDTQSGATRIDISSKVMDKTNVDNGKPHALFIATSIDREVFESREKDEFKWLYEQNLISNQTLFRQLNSHHLIMERVSIGNLLPIGVLLDSKTGELLQIIVENYRYL